MILAIVVVAAVLFSVLQSDEKSTPAPHEEAHVVHWSYEPDTGPADWGAMDPAWILCAEGRAQSPIDLTNAKIRRSDRGWPESEDVTGRGESLDR